MPQKKFLGVPVYNPENLKKTMDRKIGKGKWFVEPVSAGPSAEGVVMDKSGKLLVVRRIPDAFMPKRPKKTKLWKFDKRGRCVISNSHELPQPYVTMLATGQNYFSISDQFLRGYSGFDYTRMFGEFDSHQFPKDQGRVVWVRLGNNVLWPINFVPQRKFYPDKFVTTYSLGFVKLENVTHSVGLSASITVFVPMDDKAELWIIEIENISRESQKLDVIPTVPIFGGNRAYVEYHRDVVRLYNKTSIDQDKGSILIKPGLEWVEGHTDKSDVAYFMKACFHDGRAPDRFYTDRDTFLGPNYSWGEPISLLGDLEPEVTMLGEEAVGAIEFKGIDIRPGQKVKLYVACGIAQNDAETEEMLDRYSPSGIEQASEAVCDFWDKKVHKRIIKTQDKNFDFSWNMWWLYQLQLRFWFGNTGHPQFDYGTDFSGWREIWQDMIGTIMMDHVGIEEYILSTLEGIRLDGTNATRFFARTRKFGSDEINGLWCDHPYWTTQAILIYAEHVGKPLFLLNKKIRYFRDMYINRGDSKDDGWPKGEVGFAEDASGKEVEGTVLEHLLCQILPMFFDIGKNELLNIKRADWNDAVDQIHGESVTFSMGAVENFNDLGAYLCMLKEKYNVNEIQIAQELMLLIGNNNDPARDRKRRLQTYLNSVNRSISGQKVEISIESLVSDLREKAHVMKGAINGIAWNGEYYIAYFTRDGMPVPGVGGDDLAIYLMPQAFAIFSGVAEGDVLDKMIKSVEKYLYDEKVGGYKLNYPPYTKFSPAIGRISGFAPGTKENNAIFNHANLFYMNALLRLGRGEEAFRVWDGINPLNHPQSISMIMSWIPEYWVSSDNPNIAGKGEYPILTGSAVWTRINFERYVLGIKGETEGLRIDPCFPRRKDLDDISFEFDFRHARYKATYKIRKIGKGTARIKQISVDGEKILGNLVEPFSGGEHTILIELE